MRDKNKIEIKRTGHDYDFIAIITNNNDEDVVLSIQCLECNAIMHDHMASGPWYLKSGKSFGLFANDMGYTMLEAMESGIYCLEDPKDYETEGFDFENFADSFFEFSCSCPCACVDWSG